MGCSECQKRQIVIQELAARKQKLESEKAELQRKLAVERFKHNEQMDYISKQLLGALVRTLGLK